MQKMMRKTRILGLLAILTLGLCCTVVLADFGASNSGVVPLDLRKTHMKYSESASISISTVPVGDINRDGGVDVVDLLWLVDAFGSLMGDVNYMVTSDFNSDGYVDVVDLLIFVENFGT
jgi:hypothetical protein